MPRLCTVTTLYSYPVKSCRGTPVDSVTVSATGIEGDRQLMILHDGKFTNQARLPKLAMVSTQRVDENVIRFGDSDSTGLEHTVSPEGSETSIDFYGNSVAVVDQGNTLSGWVSEKIGTTVRVVALKSTFRRAVPLAEFSLVDDIDQSRFVDVAPILLTNEESLADLNARLDTPVPMNRFRPNVVVNGIEAFREDTLSSLGTEDFKLVRATHCERCAVTCTDQKTGQRESEPLTTLRSYRHREGGYAGGVMFGAYMGVEGKTTLKIGDTLVLN